MEDLPPSNLTESGITIPSDSENYDANIEVRNLRPHPHPYTPHRTTSINIHQHPHTILVPL